MSTTKKTFDSVFEKHMGVKPQDLAPDANLLEVDGVSEQTIGDMFVEFNEVMMPIFQKPKDQRVAMCEGMRMTPEQLYEGKFRNLQIEVGGPWTRQRVFALIAGWHNELPGDIGSG
jgi:hypothetical protein